LIEEFQAMFKDIQKLRVTKGSSVRDVVSVIELSGPVACALLYDETGRFVNVLTDGDVRRAFLQGVQMEDAAWAVHCMKAERTRPGPITVREGVGDVELHELFALHALRQVVVCDTDGQPLSVISNADVNGVRKFEHEPFTAVIMAGGFGTRMRPLTDTIPKPMLPVNGRPMLEIIIEKLVQHGADHIYLTTHYLPEVISDYFGDGSKFGVRIDYLHEEVPLGTGGALARIPKQNRNTLIFNGDILTQLDINRFLCHHLRTDSALSIAATQYRFQVPFGVIAEKNGYVERIDEKPSFSFVVNSGIYFVSPAVLSMLPTSGAFNMTDVADILIQERKAVSCFPIYEEWLDVGRPSDYDLAAKLF
jgi:dTDP-glucose pyrophosphorylase